MTELSCHHEGSKRWSPHDGMRSLIFVHYEGSIMWSPHDVMRAPAMMHLISCQPELGTAEPKLVFFIVSTSLKLDSVFPVMT